MEVELGCHGELDCLLLQVPTAGLMDFVFVTLFHTAVESTIKLQSIQAASHWWGPNLLNIHWSDGG